MMIKFDKAKRLEPEFWQKIGEYYLYQRSVRFKELFDEYPELKENIAITIMRENGDIVIFDAEGDFDVVDVDDMEDELDYLWEKYGVDKEYWVVHSDTPVLYIGDKQNYYEGEVEE